MAHSSEAKPSYPLETKTKEEHTTVTYDAMEFNNATTTKVPTSRPGLGTVSAGAGNPALDPLEGAFTPGQTESIAVVGGTGATDPIIGGTLGGLPEVFAIATGITSSIASKMYSEALLRTLAFTSTTTRGTILDTIVFDPFSGTCVNGAAALYGSIHSQFTGSVLLSIETVGNATLTGRIGVAYLPSLYDRETVVTPENLYLFDHAILDVNVSGKGTFEMKPTTNSSFIVQKGDGKYYGKLVILSFTDIANSYGTSMNIPLNIYSRLSPTSLYSGMDIAAISPSGDTRMKGFLPAFPDVRNSTLVTEGFEPTYNQVFDTYTDELYGREIKSGQNWNKYGGVDSFEQTLYQLWGSSPHLPGIETSSKEQEQFWYPLDPVTARTSTNTLYIPEGFGWTATDTALPIDYDEVDYKTFITKSLTPDIREKMDIEMTGCQGRSYGKHVRTESNRRAEAGFLWTSGRFFMGDGNWHVLWGNEDDSDKKVDPTTYVPTGLLCKSGRVIAADRVCPLGYKALRIVDPEISIPGVKPGVAGETMLYGVEMTEFMIRVRDFLRQNTEVKSITYTVSYSNGDLVADVLVNKYGLWVDSNSIDDYSLFLGELSFTTSQATRNTGEWVKLRPANVKYWNSRLFTGAGMATRRKGMREQMMASIVGGMAIGAGQGLANIGERKFLRRMQDDKQKHAYGMLNRTFFLRNQLAEQDYARKYAQQRSEVMSTQSRMYRQGFVTDPITKEQLAPPQSSQQAVDDSEENAAFEAEVAARPALYGGLGGHPPTRKNIEHTSEQQRLLQDVGNRVVVEEDEPIPRSHPVPPIRVESHPFFNHPVTRSRNEDSAELEAHFDMQAEQAHDTENTPPRLATGKKGTLV